MVFSRECVSDYYILSTSEFPCGLRQIFNHICLYSQWNFDIKSLCGMWMLCFKIKEYAFWTSTRHTQLLMCPKPHATSTATFTGPLGMHYILILLT